jgi:hypothetical protein
MPETQNDIMDDTPQRSKSAPLKKLGCLLALLLCFALQATYAQMRPGQLNPGQTVPVNDTAGRVINRHRLTRV